MKFSNIGIQSPFSQISVNNCFFGDNTIGIESLDGRNYVTISLCTFDLSSTFSAQKHVRVFYTNYYKPYINIKNNTFQSPTGVSIVEMQRSPNNSKGYVKNRITNNIVNGKSGVLFNISAPYGGTDEFPITGNIANINGTSSTHGIKVSGDSDGFNISNNELYYTATSVGYLAQSLPIYVEFLNGQNNKIENNIIDAPYAFFPEDGEYGALIKCAIHIDQAPNFQVCGNSTNNTYRGFHFSGNIDYCDFALNNIGFHYDGIDCHKMPGSPNTVLGQGVVGQNWHKNTWISDPNAYFKHSAMNTDYLWGNSPTIFRVDPNEPGNMPPGLTNNNTTSKVRPIDWFIAIPPTPPSLVENTECISPSLKKNEGLSYNEDLLIQNEYSAEYFPELWDMERSLVFKLESNEELLSDSATYNWYIANQSTSAGQYAYFDKLFKDAYNIPTNLQDSFDLLLVEIGILSDSLNLLDSIQGIDETSDDSAIRNFEEGLLLRYRTLNNLETQINSSINSYIETKLLDAEDWLDGLPDTAIYESNRKTLNDIRLKIALGFELDENDCGMLKYVADQCPLTGGLAVREAPNYLPSQYGLEYFNENKWEEQCAEQRMNIENLYHDNRVIIYPNPTRGNLTIRINDATDGEWKVFNSSGQIIAKGIISSNIFNIVFDEKSSTGIYNLSIYNSESAPIIKKFVIIH
ncbi:MAG: T9SS type A sorting domain-containing protein [Saprospiraceae bacterium]